MRKKFAGMIAILAALVVAVPAAAQSWPSKPIRMIVPFAPGGAVDVAARILQSPLTESLGQPVIVENRGGGATIPATEMIARAAPDGHTLGYLISAHATNVALQEKLPYDSLKDFTPIAFIWRAPSGVSVHPTVAANTLAELLALAKQKPGSISYGTPGNGTSMHIGMELLTLLAGVEMTHIAYRGAGPALSDAVGGQVPVIISNVATTAPHTRSGKLRTLAVTSARRSVLLPNVPTVAEQGFPGFDINEWDLLVGPARMPREVVERLNRETVRILTATPIGERLRQQGLETAAMTPEEVATFLAGEIARLGDIIRKARIKPE